MKHEEIHIYSLQELGFKRTKELVGGCVYTCKNAAFRILKIDEFYYAEYEAQTIYLPLENIKHLKLLYKMLFRKVLKGKTSLKVLN